MNKRIDDDELYPYATSEEGNRAILAAIQWHQEEQRFLEWFERYAPLVAAKLIEAGVKFPQ